MVINKTAQKLLDVLCDYGPLDAHKWAEKACFAYRTLYGSNTNYLKNMKAAGLIHVCEWLRQDVGQPLPIFKFGPGENAPKPEALPWKERRQRYRRKYNEKRKRERLLKKMKSRSMIAVLLKV